jgi:hypothetical protein
MIYLVLGIVIYTIISFWFFFSIMGYKFRKDKWYDYPLLAPVFVVATVVGWVSTLFGWNK